MNLVLIKMREYIKKKTSRKNWGKTVTREQVLKAVSGSKEEKMDAFNNMVFMGEIFERRANAWSWLG